MKPIELLDRAKVLVSLEKKDEDLLVEMGKLLPNHASEVADVFYAALDSDAEAKAILDSEEGRRDRLKGTLAIWFSEIFSGKYDEAYANRRWIIGLVHVKIGIPPLLVVTSISNVYNFSIHKLAENADKLSAGLAHSLAALTKMLSIDLAFIEQSYAESSLNAMSAELGADEALFKRFMERGATELLAAARG